MITRHLTAKNAVIFGVARRDCPLRAKCTTAIGGRTVHLHEHDILPPAPGSDTARPGAPARDTTGAMRGPRARP